jgi:hypothetical protein
MSRLIVLSRAWNADARSLALAVAPVVQPDANSSSCASGDLADLVVAVAGHARRLAR